MHDAEEALRTKFTLINIQRALSGGVNDATGFTRWLDDNLFQGATFAEFRADRRPRIWINAADIYNRTTFVFGQTAFSAMCSDLESYPIADAVAASAAVPVVFAPVVIRTYSGTCNRKLPDGSRRSAPAASPMLKVVRDRVARYHDGSMPYVKLLDGGLVTTMGFPGSRSHGSRQHVWPAHAAAGSEAASYPHDVVVPGGSVGQLDPAGRAIGTGARGGGG